MTLNWLYRVLKWSGHVAALIVLGVLFLACVLVVGWIALHQFAGVLLALPLLLVFCIFSWLLSLVFSFFAWLARLAYRGTVRMFSRAKGEAA